MVFRGFGGFWEVLEVLEGLGVKGWQGVRVLGGFGLNIWGLRI